MVVGRKLEPVFDDVRIGFALLNDDPLGRRFVTALEVGNVDLVVHLPQRRVALDLRERKLFGFLGPAGHVQRPDDRAGNQVVIGLQFGGLPEIS